MRDLPANTHPHIAGSATDIGEGQKVKVCPIVMSTFQRFSSALRATANIARGCPERAFVTQMRHLEVRTEASPDGTCERLSP
jgi:hypothetical protein